MAHWSQNLGIHSTAPSSGPGSYGFSRRQREVRPAVQPRTSTVRGGSGSGGGGGRSDRWMESFLESMTETQRRAAEDREKAIGEIRGREEKGIGALDPWKQDIEAWTPESEEALYEQSRTGIEAGTQAQMREMLEGFAPGGFRQSQMAGARESMTGRLAQARMTARGTRREDMLKLMEQKAGYGKEAAGIYERGGRTLADLYGRTIAKTPKMPERPKRGFAMAG